MFDTAHESAAAAVAAARVAASNKFGPGADLAAPEVATWIEEYAEGWLEGVRQTRDGLGRIMTEPNAWTHRVYVYAAFLDAGATEEIVIRTLRALPHHAKNAAG